MREPGDVLVEFRARRGSWLLNDFDHVYGWQRTKTVIDVVDLRFCFARQCPKLMRSDEAAASNVPAFLFIDMLGMRGTKDG